MENFILKYKSRNGEIVFIETVSIYLKTELEFMQRHPEIFKELKLYKEIINLPNRGE